MKKKKRINPIKQALGNPLGIAARRVKLPFSMKLPWAPSANLIWRSLRGGRVYLSPKYREFLEAAYAEYLKQGSPRIDDETPAVQIVLKLFPPSKHAYDVDNRIKPALDALTKLGFWKDDRIVRKITVVANEPVVNGAIVVEIDSFDNEAEETTRRSILSWYGLKPFQKKTKTKKHNKDEEIDE